MRYDAEHKARTRERVLKVASEAIRSDGPSGVGVAEIMSRAGLTHGGFYAHFKSKDALVAAAIETAFADSRVAVARALQGAQTPQETLRTYIRVYLSRSHRDGRETGCPVAALSTDVPRLGPDARAAFGEGVKALSARLSELMGACEVAKPRQMAVSVLAEMQGALALARAVADPQQSDDILSGSRRSILRRLGLDEDADERGRRRAARA